jgi:hypothetical protein
MHQMLGSAGASAPIADEGMERGQRVNGAAVPPVPAISDLVYVLVAKAAAKAKPCPTNSDMAEKLNTCTSAISSSISKLKTLQRISVEWADGKRRICIRATGYQTAWSANFCARGGSVTSEATPDYRDRMGEVFAARGLRFEDVKLRPGKLVPVFMPH